jgi:hypothetical protein
LLSTLHGPAITCTRVPPTFALAPSGTSDRSLRTSFDAILYGARIGTTFSTPSTVSSTVRSLNRSFPITATTVRSVPTITCSLSPISFTSLMTCSICSCVEPGFMTTTMGVPPRMKQASGHCPEAC